MKKITGFILPLVLGIIGISIWGVGIISFVKSFRDAGVYLQAPGTTSVTITNTGDYTIWNQTSGIFNGEFKTFPDTLPSGMVIKVLKQTDGTQVPIRSAMNSTVTINGTCRVSVAKLNFPAPGQYLVDISGLAEPRAMYLDQPKILHTILLFVTAGMTGFVFIVVAVILGIYVLVRMLSKK
jgi:hypothetical protein